VDFKVPKQAAGKFGPDRQPLARIMRNRGDAATVARAADSRLSPGCRRARCWCAIRCSSGYTISVKRSSTSLSPAFHERDPELLNEFNDVPLSEPTKRELWQWVMLLHRTEIPVEPIERFPDHLLRVALAVTSIPEHLPLVLFRRAQHPKPRTQ
jgi:hypothetical protein